MKRSPFPGPTVTALFFALLPSLAAAECQIYYLPSICDPVAQDPIHWIGEYSGHTTSFTMTINGQPYTPHYEKTGTMTIFAMSDALGFAGDGAFKGEAELQQSPRAAPDPTVDAGDWGWLHEPEVLEYIEEQGMLDTYDSAKCPLRWWPRWTGDYQPPSSPVMRLTLIATAYDQMIGRVFYSGTQNGNKVLLDSRFRLVNAGFDPTSYIQETYPDNSMECQAECTPGQETLLCVN